MYKLSISSLLVVLVTLQQHNSCVAESLTEQIEQLIQKIEVETSNIIIDDNTEVSISYNQLNEFIHSITSIPECQNNTICHEFFSQIVKFKTSQIEAEIERLFSISARDAYPYFLNEHTVSRTSVENTAPVLNIDKRNQILSLNSVLLI